MKKLEVIKVFWHLVTLFVLVLVAGAIVTMVNAVNQYSNQRNQTTVKEDFTTVTVTTYQATKEQTNQDNLITASGYRIDTTKTLNIVAVSRDLLENYPMGSIIYIKHEQINKDYGYFFVVLDKMNERHTKRIDILNHRNNKFVGVNIRRAERMLN